MLSQSFLVSLLVFYLKAKISLEDNFIRIQNPNTILKVIPLGSHKKTVAINQIASVDSNFKMDFFSFLFGLLILFFGFSMMKDSFIGGLIVLLWGALTAISSFSTVMTIKTTAGESVMMGVFVFEKSKLENVISTIEKFISQRLNDTNVRIHSEKSTDKIVEAIQNNKQ